MIFTIVFFIIDIIQIPMIMYDVKQFGSSIHMNCGSNDTLFAELCSERKFRHVVKVFFHLRFNYFCSSSIAIIQSVYMFFNFQSEFGFKLQ